MSVVCVGEALIDFVPDQSGLRLAECAGFRRAAGGAPANVAAGVARLGGEAVFLGRVGADAFGEFLIASLTAAGVHTDWIVADPWANTGLAFVSLSLSGERDFVFYRNPSADMLHRRGDVPEAALDGCRVCHYGSISLIQEPSRTTTLDTIARARARGAWISYDPNLRPPLWPSLDAARRTILETLPLADLVKVSVEEGEFLFGSADPVEIAGRLLATGARLAAVTGGASPAVLATADRLVQIPSFRVDVVDTTGAGDGFVAGVLHLIAAGLGWGSREELLELGRFGAAVGGLTCTRKGAIPALPSASEVRELLAHVARD